MGKIYYVSDSVNQGLSTAIYGNLQQSTAIYGNLQQSTAIYGNLPVPVTLPSTITTCTVTARMEGKKSAYMDFRIV